MTWITAHMDAIIFFTAIVISFLSYWVGNEFGYRKGLEDGYQDGKLNG